GRFLCRVSESISPCRQCAEPLAVSAARVRKCDRPQQRRQVCRIAGREFPVRRSTRPRVEWIFHPIEANELPDARESFFEDDPKSFDVFREARLPPSAGEPVVPTVAPPALDH